jgi:hypothetical protein
MSGMPSGAVGSFSFKGRCPGLPITAFILVGLDVLPMSSIEKSPQRKNIFISRFCVDFRGEVSFGKRLQKFTLPLLDINSLAN